jgi:ABC-type nitrate/sulfonate/bicarbonate transport system substrate-binding protein
MRTSRWLGVAVLLVWLGLACAPPGRPAPTDTAAASAPAATSAPASAASARPVDTPSNPPVTVRVAIVRSVSDSGIFIADEKGHFREQGIEVDVTQMQAGQQQVPLLGTGQLEVGSGATAAGLVNAVALDVPLRIVADKGSTPPGFGYQAVVVRKDLVDGGAFRGCSNFRGLRVANPAVENSAGPMYARMLRECGLAITDIDMIAMGFPDMPAAFRNGAIDASNMLEPLLTRTLAEGFATLYKHTDEIYPYQQNAVLLYGPQFMTNQRDVAQRFMLAYVKGLREYNDAFTRGANKAEIIDILARNTGVTDTTLVERMTPVGLNPDGYINMESFAADVEWWTSQGFIKTRVEPAAVVDHSFVDYAIERLGRYAPN